MEPIETATPATTEKLFNQAEVDRLLATHKRSLQERVIEQEQKITELVGKLPQGDERSRLETELQESRLAALSEQERRVALEKQSAEMVKAEKGQSEKWAGKYREALLDHTLKGLAAEARVFSPTVFVGYLKSFSRVEQQKDANGRYTEDYRVVCRLPDTEADCSPQEAIKRLRVTDGNFFEENVSKDVSRGIVPGSDGKVDVRKLTAAEHAKIRAEAPHLLGLRPLRKTRH